MHRPQNALSLGLLAALSGAALLSQTPTPGKADLPRFTAKELDRHPFRVGELELKFYDFRPTRKFGTRLIAFEVKNRSTGFFAFSPQDLVLVSHDGNQIVEAAPIEQFQIHPMPQRVRIAPGASIALTLYPKGTVEFPVIVYFGDNLLAEITE